LCDKVALLRLFGQNERETIEPDQPAPVDLVPAPEPELPPYLRGPQQVPDRGPETWVYNDRGERISLRLNPEPPKPIRWSIYKIAAKAVWRPPQSRKAQRNFKVFANRLMAVRR
jgi:hypothetical protein